MATHHHTRASSDVRPDQCDPSPTRRARWLPRISLRVVLLLLTVFAVAVGYYANLVHRQRQAIAHIRAKGGEAFYPHDVIDSDMLPVPERTSLRLLLGEDWAVPVVVALVGDSAHTVQADDLRILSALPQLQILHIEQNPADALPTADEFRVLDELPRLHRFGITAHTIPAHVLAAIRESTQLRGLFLDARIDDAGFEELARFESLEELHVSTLGASADGVAHLTECRNLKRLKLTTGSLFITDTLRAKLLSNNPDLELIEPVHVDDPVRRAAPRTP